jgi:hypothetical protein
LSFPTVPFPVLISFLYSHVPSCLVGCSVLYAFTSFIHPWSCALLDKPPVVQLLKNFPTFYGTRRLITVFTRALHWSLLTARSIQSMLSYSL